MIVNVNPNAVNLSANPNVLNQSKANPSIVSPSIHVIDFIPIFFYVILNGSSIEKI
jgi:hypothetical protein